MRNFLKRINLQFLVDGAALISPLIALFLCLVFTAISFNVTYRISESDAKARFTRVAGLVGDAFQEKLRLYANTALATRNLFHIYPDLPEKQFRKFLHNMNTDGQLRGVYSIGYATHTHQNITPPGSYGIWPKAKKREYFPVTYVERFGDIPSPSVRGFDLGSDEGRMVSIDKAIESMNPVATGRSHPPILPPDSQETSFSIYTPVYHQGRKLTTKAQKHDALRGIIFISLFSSKFFDTITQDFAYRYPDLAVEFFSGDETRPEHLLFSHHLHNPDDITLEQVEVISSLENTWTLRVTAGKKFSNDSIRTLPFAVLIFGLVVSIAIYLLLSMVRNRNRQLNEEKQILELSSNVGLNLKAEQDLEKIVQLVTRSATHILEAKSGAFKYILKNEKGEEQNLYSLSGPWRDVYSRIGERLLTKQLENPKVIRITDISKDPDLHDLNGEAHSFLSAPMISKTGKVWGGLFFVHPDVDHFSKRSELIAEAIAIQAATAMDNAHLYRSLRLAQEDALAANEAKSIFLANMSHEIRTPLGVIIGFADLAKSSNNPQESEKYLELIQKNGQELTRIIGEILDLSKIEAHSLQIEEADFSFNSLLDDIYALLDLRAKEKGLSLIIEKDPQMPPFIKSDRTRIRQILVNLLGNALRFTEKGSVKVKITSQKNPNSNYRTVEFSVTDTGIGIPADQQKNLFKAFTQANSSISRKFGGTGLGLVIARELAIALGGSLELQSSSPDKGTCFAGKILVLDSLPNVSSKDMEEAPETGAVLNGVRVLIVDDARDNQLLFTTYLKKVGAQIDTASDGKEGLELALKNDYDVVLLDLQMPVMDGYETIVELRRNHYKKHVIALTAHALKDEKEKAMKLGFDEYLTKPVQKNLLIKTIENFAKIKKS